MSSSAVPSIDYYGLSSFELRIGETRLLVDPWLTEPDWVDMSLNAFEDVDVILVTHGAYDHLGDAASIAKASGATVYTEPAVANHLVREGVPMEQVERVIWGNVFETHGIEVHVLETRHLSYFESGGQSQSGMPLGFHFELSDKSVYYVGDTSLFSDLELFVDLNEPDVVMLPVGGAPNDRAPLPPQDAATVASWLDVETIIPVHYVPGSKEPEKFRSALADRTNGRGPVVAELSVGDCYEI